MTAIDLAAYVIRVALGVTAFGGFLIAAAWLLAWFESRQETRE